LKSFEVPIQKTDLPKEETFKRDLSALENHYKQMLAESKEHLKKSLRDRDQKYAADLAAA
jgi:hypothetical protein